MYKLDEIINKVICGDCITVMKGIPDNSIDCCITSPPYWGLRDYGTAKWEGGDPTCDHKQYLGGHGEKSQKQLTSEGTQKYNYKDTCGKCGAKRIDSQLGLEKTPEEYVTKMVEVFREVKRVLKKEGTLWLNLGDSYAGSGCETNDYRTEASKSINKSDIMFCKKPPQQKIANIGLKPKDLVGIPWKVAFALQSDGWYLRQDIIWAKPNPMPESVTDRCTKSHEYIFLLAKSRSYYYDSEAIKEPNANPKRTNYQAGSRIFGKNNDRNDNDFSERTKDVIYDGRNKRSVWVVTTKPFSDAHFATFPKDLIKPMVLAGCPRGGIVLDPFMGAGTTGLVAKKLNRNYIGIELNPDYIKMAEKRINNTEKPLF